MRYTAREYHLVSDTEMPCLFLERFFLGTAADQQESHIRQTLEDARQRFETATEDIASERRFGGPNAQTSELDMMEEATRLVLRRNDAQRTDNRNDEQEEIEAQHSIRPARPVFRPRATPRCGHEG